MKRALFIFSLAIFAFFCASESSAQTPKTQPQFEEWKDDFSGEKLDEAKWEKFTFEGGSGGKLEVKNGEVRIRSANRTRAGIRTKNAFSSDKFIVEAQVAKIGAALPEPGNSDAAVGFANLTILFDGSGRNRIEWILRNDGNFEAWAIRDGQGERLDNKKLATKIKNPYLSIVRRGDEFLFILNSPEGKAEDAQVGLTTTVRNMPKSFHVMLYGFGSSENNWSSLRVVTPKQ